MYLIATLIASNPSKIDFLFIYRRLISIIRFNRFDLPKKVSILPDIKVYMKNISIYILVLSLSFTTTLQSQTKKIDSLKIELQNHKTQDTLRVNILNDLADSFLRKDFEKTMSYLNESETIAKATDYKKGYARSQFIRGLAIAIKTKYKSGDKFYKEALLHYEGLDIKKNTALINFNLGVFSSRNKDYKSSIDYYSKSIKIKEEIGYKKIYNDVYYLARAYAKTGNFKESVSNYKKALGISEQTNNSKRIENCLSSIGNVYSHQGNYQLALEFMNKSLFSAKKNNNIKNISDALVSIGNVYIRLQNYDKAILYHNDALIETNKANKRNIGTISHNLGESYKYKKEYKKALELFEKSIIEFKKFNNNADIAVSLNKIGEIYLEQNKNTEADSYFNQARKINIEANNPRGLCGSYLGLAKTNYNIQKYNAALNNAFKGKELAKKLELLDLQRDIAHIFSKIYEKKGKHKNALDSHQEFKNLNDSLFNKENIEKITQLEYEYKHKQAIDSASIRELKLNKTVKAVNQDLENTQRNLLLGVIVFLGMVLILGGIIFSLKLKHARTKTQNIMIEQKLLRSQMTPHFIFNSLSVLQGMILNKEEKKSVSYLSKFSKLLRTVLENSRYKTVPLSDELSAIDSYMTLQNLDVNPPFEYNLKVASEIDETSIEIPPMLIQPFIENAIEHAFPNKKEDKKISVQLAFKGDKLVCTIEDNGIGINFNQQKSQKNKSSLATTITSERLEMLAKEFKTEGSLSLVNSEAFNKQGTLVTLIIPYKFS